MNLLPELQVLYEGLTELKHLIESLTPNPHKKAKDEAVNLGRIQAHINENTLCGQKIKAAFPGKPVFDKWVSNGGTRGDHTDGSILWVETIKTVERVETVEYKGCRQKKPFDPAEPPWANAVQFYNGTGSKFTLGHNYAKKFYDTMLDEIIAYFHLETPKPSYEAWAKDVFLQSKPKTSFVKELREKGYRSKYLSDRRKIFNQNFILTVEDLKILTDEVFEIANTVLEEKAYWLQINGPMNEPEDFEVRWTGKLAMSEITAAKQLFNRSASDINVQFTCRDGAIFYAKMRWGYGQCITNLRVDLK